MMMTLILEQMWNHIKFLDMLLQWFMWIAHLLNASIWPIFSFSLRKVVVKQLPDDVIVDILSRLPAERVLECRRVCRRWRSLTLSDHFIKLHLSRATPAIFVQALRHERKGKRELGFFVYDPTIANRKKTNKLRLGPNIVMNTDFTELFGSCDGLLLFADWRSFWRCYVFNPVRQEQIAIDCPSPGYICGLFSHPLTKEYRILYLHYPGYGRNQYFVYTVGGSSWRKINSPPFHYGPRNVAPPAICNGALHWITKFDYDNREAIPPCTSGIMVFGIDTEEFHTFPHPGMEQCGHARGHASMRLLVANDVLSFFWTRFGEEIDIWNLEDYTNWVWVRKWKLNLNLLWRNRNFDSCFRNVELVHFEDGQVLLNSSRNGLYLYQLDHHHSVKKLQGPPHSPHLRCTAFTRSLLCLRQLSPVRINC